MPEGEWVQDYTWRGGRVRRWRSYEEKQTERVAAVMIIAAVILIVALAVR